MTKRAADTFQPEGGELTAELWQLIFAQVLHDEPGTVLSLLVTCRNAVRLLEPVIRQWTNALPDDVATNFQILMPQYTTVCITFEGFMRVVQNSGAVVLCEFVRMVHAVQLDYALARSVDYASPGDRACEVWYISDGLSHPLMEMEGLRQIPCFPTRAAAEAYSKECRRRGLDVPTRPRRSMSKLRSTICNYNILAPSLQLTAPGANTPLARLVVDGRHIFEQISRLHVYQGKASEAPRAMRWFAARGRRNTVIPEKMMSFIK